MIDWYSGLIGYDASRLRPNYIAEVTAEGEVIWTAMRKLQVEGSYSSTVRVGVDSPSHDMLMSADKHGLLCASSCLYVSGNPSKFLQGHNVVGPSVSSLGAVLRAMVRAFPEDIRPSDADSDQWAAIKRGRIDLTTTVDLGSHELVHRWLRAAEMSTRTRHRHGRAFASGDTVYWGQHSRHWSLKAYCKHCELQAHPPKMPSEVGQALSEWSWGKLRIELCLRTPELKRLGTLTESVIWEYFERIQGGIMPDDEIVGNVRADLPRAVEGSLLSWQRGERLEWRLPKRTFYRHRRLILDALGVDISLPYQAKPGIEAQALEVGDLQARECGDNPEGLQAYLFKPEPGPSWGEA